ncbi:class I ribonucleotide reductase maintenance protein YfaE [Aliivibrio fischeri]|uniref:2Fe-2S ferredoxin-like protein n=1 Tax=Aliivibrio fischeri TaxID=668 RepID=A0A844P6J4_ALIFS|nr:class I ribonucleotide reductase maintenance protein YfaE [Aliivibrio fischeri]MUK50865.1 2Fe-2S ferredoxin-like protein [Aliivibrio fischeri]
MTKIHINKIITLHNTSHRSLLEVMEQQGLIVESQCRSGDCGTCRCTLVSGEVEYQSLPLAFIGPSEILPCVCKAKTDLVIEGLQFQTLVKKA